MNITKSLLIIFIPLLIVSCKKDSSDNNPSGVPSNSKIKTYTEDVTSSGGDHLVVTFDVTYDSGNRLLSLTSESNAGDKFLYSYSNNKYSQDLYNSNALSIHEDFYLNANSFVDSTLQYDDSEDTSTEKYIYNSAKQLITLKEYEYSKVNGAELDNTTNYVYDGKGNVISETDDFTVTTYDYYTDLTNNLIFLQIYLPGNKNLIKTTTINSGGEINIVAHTYTFDSSNRISTEKQVADDGEIVIKTYTYY